MDAERMYQACAIIAYVPLKGSTERPKPKQSVDNQSRYYLLSLIVNLHCPEKHWTTLCWLHGSSHKGHSSWSVHRWAAKPNRTSCGKRRSHVHHRRPQYGRAHHLSRKVTDMSRRHKSRFPKKVLIIFNLVVDVLPSSIVLSTACWGTMCKSDITVLTKVFRHNKKEGNS